MSRYLVGAFAALACAAGVWIGASVQPANAQPQPKVAKWEYKVVKVTNTEKAIADELNKLGAEGWEYSDGYGTEYYLLRRPK